MNPTMSILWRALAAALSLAGLAGFITIFIRHLNVYWFILAPVIFAVYQIPGVLVYALWKRKTEALRQKAQESRED